LRSNLSAKPAARRPEAAGAEGVGGDGQPELPGRDVQVPQEQRPQRADDHEVEDDRELQERENATTNFW